MPLRFKDEMLELLWVWEETHRSPIINRKELLAEHPTVRECREAGANELPTGELLETLVERGQVPRALDHGEIPPFAFDETVGDLPSFLNF